MRVITTGLFVSILALTAVTSASAQSRLTRDEQAALSAYKTMGKLPDGQKIESHVRGKPGAIAAFKCSNGAEREEIVAPTWGKGGREFKHARFYCPGPVVEAEAADKSPRRR